MMDAHDLISKEFSQIFFEGMRLCFSTFEAQVHVCRAETRHLSCSSSWKGLENAVKSRSSTARNQSGANQPVILFRYHAMSSYD